MSSRTPRRAPRSGSRAVGGPGRAGRRPRSAAAPASPWRIYGELAPHWPLLSRPEDYAEEGATFRRWLRGALGRDPRDLLELGSGGGNTASHCKAWTRPTLADLSPGMVEVSRRLNPECRHLVGDMRTLRLRRRFDAVLVHDAVMYLRGPAELGAVMRTAAFHLRPGGAALFVPDCTAETFRPEVFTGGHDGADGRSLRYQSFVADGDPADGEFEMRFVVRLEEPGRKPRLVEETHRHGLFPRVAWLAALEAAGLEARAVPFRHSTFPPDRPREAFLGVRRA
jgi:SAM-dependent methyltransferase